MLPLSESCKKAPGNFLLDGKPVLRGTIENSSSDKRRKLYYCGTCGALVNRNIEKVTSEINCRRCCSSRKNYDRKDEGFGGDQKELLNAWKEGVIDAYSYSSTSEPSVHSSYSLASPSLSSVSYTNTSGVSSPSFQSYKIPPGIHSSVEWNGALLLGWKKRKDDNRFSSYPNHQTPQKEFIDFLKTGPRAIDESALLKEVPTRLWLPSYKENRRVTSSNTTSSKPNK
jgi:DNA-directed RNA polymerase subunit RPC12/RpoP